jgi:hypothetical protein
MIIVKPVGGLASQIQKYAIGRALADKHGVDLKLDMSWFESTPEEDTSWEFWLDKFNIDIKKATPEEIKKLKPSTFQLRLSNLLKRLFKIKVKFKHYSNESFIDVDKFWQLPDELYLEGEFSGTDYFEPIRDVICKEVQYRLGTSKQMDEYVNYIKTSKPTIAIHFRRGDYISNPNAAKFHYLCSKNYYLEALNWFKSKFGDFSLLVFSDDLDWVKENVPFDMATEVRFVDDLQTNEEFQLLSLCHHNIISNSGFSWLASWLNVNENIIVSPTNWVKDVQINQKIIESLNYDNMVFIDK